MYFLEVNNDITLNHTEILHSHFKVISKYLVLLKFH